MYNYQSHPVHIGSTGNDEMCNFYMMYWVEGDKLLEENTCNSAGPPNYYFAYDRNLNIEKIPASAYRIPPPPNGPEPGEPIQGGHHSTMHHKSKPNKHHRRFQYTF